MTSAGSGLPGWPAELRTAGSPDGMAPAKITEFQRRLLPSGLPVLPRLRIAARYVAISADDKSGAGWCDAIALLDGAVALTVGDTVGDGIGAVASMGLLRAALNERLGSSSDLGTVLTLAGELADRTAGLGGATMALARLDPEDGSFVYLTCGNPPPLVLRGGSTPEFLNGRENGPVGSGGTPLVSATQLQPGDVVLLYNLGMVERPGRTIGQAMSEFGQAAVAAVSDQDEPAWSAGSQAERACQVADEMQSRTGYARDATVLVAEMLTAPASPLTVGFRADIGDLQPARAEFREWLAEAGVVSPDLEDLQLAIGELLTNAIVHAYPPGSRGPIELRASLSSNGTVECTVTDHGTWKTPDLAESGGNGLMVASSMADRLRIDHPRPEGPNGTVATLRQRLNRPVMFDLVPRAQTAERRPGLRVNITSGTDPDCASAEVAGSVDDRTDEILIRRLLAASRGGTLRLVVDLSRVTHLDSAGIWSLCQLADQLSAQGRQLTVVAPRSGYAHPMLELAALPHEADRRQAPPQVHRSEND